jgi:hypothetical protein
MLPNQYSEFGPEDRRRKFYRWSATLHYPSFRQFNQGKAASPVKGDASRRRLDDDCVAFAHLCLIISTYSFLPMSVYSDHVY